MNWYGWVISILGAMVFGRIMAALRVSQHSYIRSGSWPRHRSARWLLSLALAFLLGVGLRFVIAPLLRDHHSQVVASLSAGPDGAKSTLFGGGYIDIPRGALAQPTTIQVHKRPVEQRVQLDSSSRGAPLNFSPGELSVYELTPVDTVLSRPIELALPIPAGQNVVVFVTANGEQRTLPGVVAGDTARVSISNFDFKRPGAISVAH